MERIKQAIENARRPEASRSGRPDLSHVHSHYTKPVYAARHRTKWDIAKNVGAAVIIFFGGWAWLRLDFMNEIELLASESINDGVKQARAEIKKRLEDEAKFRQLILQNLAHCQERAERDKESYVKLVTDAVRRKNEKNEKLSRDKHEQNDRVEKFVIPQAAIHEAARMLAAAKAECQQIYDTQLQNGK